MLRTGARILLGSQGDHQAAVVHPGQAVLLGVDAVNHGKQCLLLGKGVQVDDQGLGRALQPGPVG